MTTRHDRLTEVFLGALDRESSEREEYIDRACAGDPEMRREVAEMLRRHDDHPSFLDSVHSDLGEGGAPVPRPDRIGPYKIVGVLGEGGMGRVYLGEQEHPIRRRVAVKLIRSGLATREIIARFETERQALARMSHPNIAGVIDAGATADGLPFFAMEYVDGRPLTDYCAERRLDVAGRLELFMEVCEGVQHAHHKGIIHRDLKPSNLLVTDGDGRPLPKIIDFGVAKALEADEHGSSATRAGQLIGTPAYMSPEQAAFGGEVVDTRTDVYALGAVLYELLTGVPPFGLPEPGLTGLDRMRRRILEDEPLHPSAVASRNPDPVVPAGRLRGDLDWIALKALEKQPPKRYSSPLDVVADIRRHLAHEPVEAGPPSRVYRARKFVRKHRTAVGFAGSVGVLLAVFSGTLAWQLRETARERDRAEQVSDFLVDLLRPDSAERLRLRLEGPMTQTDIATLHRILETGLEKIDDGLAERPGLQARLLHTMGELYGATGRNKKGLEVLARAEDQLNRLGGPESRRVLQVAVARGALNVNAGRHEEAGRILETTLDRQRHLLGEDHPDTLRTMRELVLARLGSRRYEDARRSLEELLGHLRRVRADDDLEVLTLQSILGGVLLELRRLDEAETVLRWTRDLLVRSHGPRATEVRNIDYNLACIHALRGDTDAAMESLRLAVGAGFAYRIDSDENLGALAREPGFEKLVHDAWLNNSYVWTMFRDHARSLALLGHYADASGLFQELLDAKLRTRPPDDEDVLLTRFELADTRLLEGRLAEAGTMLESLLADARGFEADDPELLGTVLWSLAQVHLARGDETQGLRRLQEARDVVKVQQAEDSLADSLLRAQTLALSGERRDAIRSLRTAVEAGYSSVNWILRDQALRSLHGDPEFERLIRDVRRRFSQEWVPRPGSG